MSTAIRPSPEILLAAHRAVRRLARDEAPLPGTLVRDGEGVSVLVDMQELTGWPGWRFRDEHVLGALDIVHMSDPPGHAALLPWCVTSLRSALASHRPGLSAGEAVTLGVSVLRGVRALSPPRGDEGPSGAWWITDGGRPVYVPDAQPEGPSPAPQTATTTRTCVGESQELLRAAASRCHDRHTAEVLARVADDLATLALHDAEREAELFACAKPAPLAFVSLGVERETPGISFSQLISGVSDSPLADESGRPERGSLPGVGALVRRLVARHLDRGLAVTFAESLEHLRIRRRGTADRHAPTAAERRTPVSRRRPVVVAMIVAVVIVAVGALWPGGRDVDAGAADDAAESSTRAAEGLHDGTRSPSSVAPERSSQGAATEPPSPSPAEEAEPEIADALDALLTARVACIGRGGGECFAEVLEDPASGAGEGEAGAADLPSAHRDQAVLDDLGGAAVVRVDAVAPYEGATQIVVVVMTGDGWRVRDIRSLTG